MIDLIKLIPGAAWSGIAGATIALLGVFLASWQNLKRQRDQHLFDEREKKRDRIANLRRDVYLPLATSWQEANSYLGNLIGTADLDGKPMTNFSAAAYRLSVVAEMPTALLANKVNTELTKVYIRLSLKTQPALAAKKEAEVNKEFRLSSQENAKAAQAEIHKYLRSAQSDRKVIQALISNKKFYSDQVDRYWTAEIKAQNTYTLLTLDYLKVLTIELPELSNLGFSLLVQARNDLGLETDEINFRAAYSAQQEEIAKVMHNFANELERQLLDGEESSVQS